MQAHQLRLLILVSAVLAAWHLPGVGKAGFPMSGTWNQSTGSPAVRWDYPVDGLTVTGFPCRDSGRYAVVFSASAMDENGALLALTAGVVADACGDCSILALPGTDKFLFEGPAGTYGIGLEAQSSSGSSHEISFPLTLYPRMPLAPTAGCEDTIHVVLEADCQVKGYYNFVANQPVSCTVPSDFEVWVNDEHPGNRDTIDGPGLWAYLIKYRSDWKGLAGPLDPRRLVMAGEGVDFSWPLDATTASAWLKTGYSSGTHLFSAGFDASGSMVLEWDVTGAVDLRAWKLDRGGRLDSLVVLPTAGGLGLSFDFVPGDRLLVHTALERDVDTPFPVVQWSDVRISYTGYHAKRAEEIICKGMIRAEDKRLPLVLCPEEVIREGIRHDSLQLFSGVFSSGSDWLQGEALSDCMPASQGAEASRYFATYAFRPGVSGDYDFLLQTGPESSAGGIVLYSGAFDPEQPCKGLLGYFIQEGQRVPFLRFELDAEKTYVLVVVGREKLVSGSYGVEIRHEAGALLPGLPRVAVNRRVSLYAGDIPAVRGERSSFSLLDMPVFVDHCGIADTVFYDEVLSSGDCGEILLRRHFRVTDNSGNYADCSYDLLFGQPSLDILVLPPPIFAVGCDQPVPFDADGYVLPEWSGYPMLETLDGWVAIRQTFQNLAVVYEDGKQITHCGGAFSYVRNWTLLDWCRPADVAVYAQVIKVGDFSPPSLSLESATDTLHYSASNTDCTAAFLLPLPVVEDACSDWQLQISLLRYVSRPVWNAFGEVIDTLADTLEIMHFPKPLERRFVTGLAIGGYGIRYVATDACGYTSERIVPLQISDGEPPVAVCVDFLTVHLNIAGEAVLFATEINEGSQDFCNAPIHLESRRSGEYIWKDAVYFSCADIGDTVTVYLQVTDIQGNRSSCVVQVAVEDNSLPKCVAPSSLTINRMDLPPGFVAEDTLQLQDLFGLPTGIDNCSFSWREKTPMVMLDVCGVGTITRHFEVTDGRGNSSIDGCTQVIRIEPGHHYAIKFPRDASFDCSSPGMADSLSVIDFKDCDLISVATQDKYSFSADQQCYLIFRTYEIINWCEFDGWGDPVIVSRDEDCDGISGEEDVWVLRTREQIFVDRDNDADNPIPAAAEKKAVCHTATQQAGFWRTVHPAAVNGYWSYTQIIEVNDTHAPEISLSKPAPVCVYGGSDCSVEIDYLFLVLDNCNPDGLLVSVAWDAFSDGTIDRDLPVRDSTGIGIVSGAYPKFRIRDRMPIGRHTYIIAARDACGNFSQGELVFEVVDCEAPAVKCIQGLATELTGAPVPHTDRNGDNKPDRAFSIIRVEDILAGSTYDCSAVERYSINKAGEVPDPFATSVVLTCDDLPAVTLELYVWDNAFNPMRIQPDGTQGGPNYSKCETTVFVQDNLYNFCSTLDIEGNIRTADGRSVAGVEVSLNGAAAATIAASDQRGGYRFTGVAPQYDYTIFPHFAGDPLAGVTTFDLLAIAEHILGVATLQTPYQLLAADADHSGSITALDLLLLRSLILRRIKTFPDGKSWQFVDADYVFRHPQSPWRENYPEVINISSEAGGTRTNFDFVAIKMGDVVEGRSDLMAGSEALAGLRIEQPSGDNTWDRLGVFLDVDIPLHGMQFSLDYLGEAVDALEIIPGVLSMHEIFYDAGTRQIHVSAMGTIGNSPDLPLFEVAGMGAEAQDLRLSDSGLSNEIYTFSQGRRTAVPILQDRSGKAGRVLDAFPNPVRDQLFLPLVLHQEGWVVTEVYSLSGILLHRQSNYLLKGNHTLPLAYPFGEATHPVYVVAIKGPGISRVQKVLSWAKN